MIPAHPKYMVAMFSLILIGLALVTVCINVVQEKISLIYKRILLRMLEVCSSIGYFVYWIVRKIFLKINIIIFSYNSFCFFTI